VVCCTHVRARINRIAVTGLEYPSAAGSLS